MGSISPVGRWRPGSTSCVTSVVATLGVCAAEAQADRIGVMMGWEGVLPMSRDGWVVGGRGEQGCRGPFTVNGVTAVMRMYVAK